MNLIPSRAMGICLGALAAAAYSCSPGGGNSTSSLGLGSGAAPSMAGRSGLAGSGANAGSSSTTGGSSGTGGAEPGVGGTAFIDPKASTPDPPPTMVEEDAACGTGQASASLKQVNMFVMFDRSWSMTECGDGSTFVPGGDPRCTTGPSRWELTSEALRKFFQDPGAAGLAVALRFFPDDHPAVGCDGFGPTGGFGMPPDAGTTTATDNCSADACAKPLVELGTLSADPAPADAQEQMLLAAVDTSAPPDVATLAMNPQTPTSAALAGAAQWATAYQAAHPDDKTVIVLITDGEPAGCDTNVANIARIASDVLASSDVDTYVIGLTGSNEATLDQIAAAGGTEQAYTVSDGNTATSDLLAKLLAIRGEAIACDIAVPKSDSTGNQIDPHLINVEYTSGTATTGTELGLVGSLAECGTELGWYYDDPTNPTTILLCPAACDLVTKDAMAHLEVLAGCKPHVVVPR